MKLKDVTEWLSTLPKEFLEYDIVNGEGGLLSEDDEEFTYRVDKPITALVVDEDTHEIVFTNDPDIPHKESEYTLKVGEDEV